jgi:hypothetical protein
MGTLEFRGTILLVGVCFLFACGGSSGGSGSSVSAVPFSLSVMPSSPSVVQGSSTALSIQVTATNGFSGSVTITAGGLPAGVTVSPASLVVDAGSSGNLTIQADATAPVEQAQVTLQGVSGSLTAHDNFTLAVKRLPRFVSVGGAVVGGFYDQSRNLLFASNEGRNEVDVISGADLSIHARVSVPVPAGIDQAADGNTIVVGTFTQGIYTINEQTLAVAQHLCPNFSTQSSTVVPFKPVAMADGKVLLLGNEIGISSGVQHLIEMDLATGSCTEHSLPGTYANAGPQTFYGIQRSADHNWAVIGSGWNIYLYDAATDSFTYTSPPTVTGGVEGVAANPDGTQFAVIGPQAVLFYNQGLAIMGTVTESLGTYIYHNALYSSDGSRLYWLPNGGVSNVDVIDTANFTDLGSITSVFDISGYGPATYLLAVDSSQRAFMGDAGTVATLDCSKPRPGSPTGNPNSLLSYPDAIPLNTSTAVQYNSGPIPQGTTITFGGVPGTVQNVSPITVVPPASSVAGPVDTTFTLPDGEAYLVPNGFAYGNTVASSTATLLPPTGSPWLNIFGYGLLNGTFGAPTVTVGGKQSPSVLVNNNLTTTSAWNEIYAQAPDGKAGPADITVSGSVGTGSLQAAVTYIPSATVVPEAGVTKVLYDPHRNVVYALTATQTGVLNTSTLQWQASIPVGGSAMALTPDGSRLLVGNSALYVINPDSPSQMTWTQLPGEVSSMAATNTGKVFIAFTGNNLTSPIEFDLATMTYTNLSASLVFPDYAEFAGTPDGAHVVFAVNLSPGAVGVWNATTDSFTAQSLVLGFWTDVAVSPDGSLLASLQSWPSYAGTDAAFWDQNLHLLNYTFYPDLAPPDAEPALGAIFSPGGHTLLAPTGDAIEFFDSQTGALRSRLLSPEPMPVITYPSPSPGGIALEPTGQTIYAVSDSGVTVFKLPAPVDQISAPASFSAPATVGNTVSTVLVGKYADGAGAARAGLRVRFRIQRGLSSPGPLRLSR